MGFRTGQQHVLIRVHGTARSHTLTEQIQPNVTHGSATHMAVSSLPAVPLFPPTSHFAFRLSPAVTSLIRSEHSHTPLAHMHQSCQMTLDRTEDSRFALGAVYRANTVRYSAATPTLCSSLPGRRAIHRHSSLAHNVYTKNACVRKAGSGSC